MSRFTKSCFAAGTACLMTAAFLRLTPTPDSGRPDRNPFVDDALASYPRAARTASLSSLTPRPTRSISVPASYRSRAFQAASPAAAGSPLPVWNGGVQRRRSSEELLERAMRELAREVYELKRRNERESAAKPETVSVAVPEPLEDLPAARRTEDPLAHLPPVRRRKDIESAGTSFRPFGFTPFRSDWADVVFRPFTTPGLI